MPVYKKVNKDFFKKWTPEMAYVLGFFMADGHISINDRGGHYFSIQIADKDILKYIRSVMGSNHTIARRKRKNHTHLFLYRIQIGSKEICSDLEKLGIVKGKTFRLALPRVPRNVIGHFIRGYFDGDGNVWIGLIHKDRKKSMYTISSVFTSCSWQFLVQFHEKLKELGIQGGCIYRSKHNYTRLQLSINDSLKLYKIMYNNSSPPSVCIKRKREVFERYIKMRP